MYDAKYHKSCLKHHISTTKYSSCQTKLKNKQLQSADQTIYCKASKFTEVIDKTFFSKEIQVMTLNWGLWWHTEDTGPCLFSIYLQLYSVCSICLSERSWLGVFSQSSVSSDLSWREHLLSLHNPWAHFRLSASFYKMYELFQDLYLMCWTI